MDEAKLEHSAPRKAALKSRDKDDALETVEAVISPDSRLIGNTPQDLRMRRNYEVNMLALRRAGEPSRAGCAQRFAPAMWSCCRAGRQLNAR